MYAVPVYLEVWIRFYTAVLCGLLDREIKMAVQCSTEPENALNLSLIQTVKRSATPLSGCRPTQYKLKFLTTLRKHQLIKCRVDYGSRFRGKTQHAFEDEKVIMVVGATGAGKSTLINGFVNYIYGIKAEDGFRLRVIDECQSLECESQSQTKNITAYTFSYVYGMKISYSLTIIDTPGFGDTGGISRDREITKRINSFFSIKGSEGIDQLHAVLFVTPASLPRLTATQMYVFEAILGIFGNDIKDNIYLMTTFADGQKPKVLSAVLAAQVPYSHYLSSTTLLFTPTFPRSKVMLILTQTRILLTS